MVHLLGDSRDLDQGDFVCFNIQNVNSVTSRMSSRMSSRMRPF